MPQNNLNIGLQETKQEIALKRLWYTDDLDSQDSDFKRLKSEPKFAMAVEHENIVEIRRVPESLRLQEQLHDLYDYCISGTSPRKENIDYSLAVIGMEYCSGGSLEQVRQIL